jgi:hypothetical protein
MRHSRTLLLGALLSVVAAIPSLAEQLARGELAGWRKHLGMTEAEWKQEVQKGLELAFRQQYARDLARLEQTIRSGNPLRVDEGRQALASLREYLPLASKHGVTLADAGQKSSSELAERQRALDALAARAAELETTP